MPWPIPLMLPPEDSLDWSEEPAPELDDGFAVLREILDADIDPFEPPGDDPEAEAVAADDDPDELAVALGQDLARLGAEVDALRMALAEANETAEAWEAEAVALRAELDEARAEARVLRAELEAVIALADEPPYEGPERRDGDEDARTTFERLSQGERRRGLAPRVGRRRPLRARPADEADEPVHEPVDEPVVEPVHEPVDEPVYEVLEVDDDEHYVLTSHELVTNGWSGRLREVSDATAPWGPEDLERLRVER